MNNHKLVLTSIAVSMSFIMVTAGPLYAQQNLWYEKNWAAYTNYISTTFGISNSMSEQFVDLNKYYVIHRIPEDRSMGVGYLHGPVLQTKDKKCILMYPALPWHISREDMEKAKKTALINRRLAGDTSTVGPQVATNSSLPRSLITAEIKATMGLLDDFGRPLKDSVHFNFNDHVTIIAGKKAKEMFNADSIYVYDLPLKKLYQGKYTYRTGMVLSRQDRATLVFKWFFTTKGKDKQQEYINMLREHVWYREDFEHEEE